MFSNSTEAKRRACILSSDKSMYRYLEIELMLLGYTVSDNKTDFFNEPPNFDLMIFYANDDSAELLSKIHFAKYNILITHGNHPKELTHDFNIILRYPFSLSDLKNILIDRQSFHTPPEGYNPEEDKSFIINKNDNSVIYRNTAVIPFALAIRRINRIEICLYLINSHLFPPTTLKEIALPFPPRKRQSLQPACRCKRSALFPSAFSSIGLLFPSNF